MKAIDQMVIGLGQLLMRPGGWILGKAVGFWQNAADLVTKYLKINPMTMSIDGGETSFFKSAMGGIFNVMMAAGAALAVLYCMISFINDSTDPKMSLTPQVALKYFARLSIVLGLLGMSTTIATDICAGVVQIVTNIAVDANEIITANQLAIDTDAYIQDACTFDVNKKACMAFLKGINNEIVQANVDGMNPGSIEDELQETASEYNQTKQDLVDWFYSEDMSDPTPLTPTQTFLSGITATRRRSGPYGHLPACSSRLARSTFRSGKRKPKKKAGPTARDGWSS